MLGKMRSVGREGGVIPSDAIRAKGKGKLPMPPRGGGKYLDSLKEGEKKGGKKKPAGRFISESKEEKGRAICFVEKGNGNLHLSAIRLREGRRGKGARL